MKMILNKAARTWLLPSASSTLLSLALALSTLAVLDQPATAGSCTNKCSLLTGDWACQQGGQTSCVCNFSWSPFGWSCQLPTQ